MEVLYSGLGFNNYTLFRLLLKLCNIEGVGFEGAEFGLYWVRI